MNPSDQLEARLRTMLERFDAEYVEYLEDPYHVEATIQALAKAAWEYRILARENANLVSQYDEIRDIDAELAKALGCE